MNINAEHITKTFGTFTALRDVSLHVPSGALVALLGPSGSGKTTLLRIIAGLELPDSGRVLLEGEDITCQPLRDRQVGFVFQHYALFRHMTVFKNVAFGLNVRNRRERPKRAEIRERVNRLLRLVQLEQFADRYPSQLSGGQRQRVALARVLAIEPRVLLLDEPFGALDAQVRKELRRWLRRLHAELHITSVFVTHDQEEAMEVADHVVVMNEGCVEQVGTPEEVYHHPANPFVYKFIGDVNLFHGRTVDGQLHLAKPEDAQGVIDTVNGSDRATRVFVRPHSFRITRERGGRDSVRATVHYINPARPLVKVELTSEWGEPVHVDISHDLYHELQIETGSELYLTPTQFKMFDEEIGAPPENRA